MRQHGEGKRRIWRKLHLAVDTANGEILAHELGDSGAHDGLQLQDLLDQIDADLDAVSAYDSVTCHKAILASKAKPVIPPRRGASISPPSIIKDPPPTRGQAVNSIVEIERKAWKREA